MKARRFSLAIRLGCAGLVLFGFVLCFGGAAVFMVWKAVKLFLAGSWGPALGFVVDALLFSGALAALLFELVPAVKAISRSETLEAGHPQEPWLWRSDWAEEWLKPTDYSRPFMHWCMALLCAALTVPFFIYLPRLLSGKQWQPWLVLAVLVLLSLWLFSRAFRTTLCWCKFGRPIFRMFSKPGVIGGYLTGAVEIPCRLCPVGGFKLWLKCVRHIPNDGMEVLYREEQTVLTELPGSNPDRTAIPLRFAIPAHTPESGEHDGHNFSWLLEVRAEMPGIDFFVEFNVPVFKLPRDGASP
jgi:hypothetical protein